MENQNFFKKGEIDITEKPYKYFMCIDVPKKGYEDVEFSVYSLIRVLDKKIEVILSKNFKDKNTFEDEVKNLSKYFNAKIYET